MRPKALEDGDRIGSTFSRMVAFDRESEERIR